MLLLRYCTLMLLVLSATPAAAAIDDCIDATCRITAPDGGRGTGCVFEVSQGRVYVLTAAHVVGQSRRVECEFWRHGHRSSPLAGQVTARNEAADAAIVVLGQPVFGGVLPTAIPLAPRDHVLRPGQPVVSVGCAGGSWSTGFKGHVLGYQGADLLFVPGPANGRSGSAIFDAAGQRIVGLLRARSMDDSHGFATSVQALYGAFAGPSNGKSKTENVQLQIDAQCPGGQCPTVPSQGDATPWRLLPYRHYQDERFRQIERQLPEPGSTWPTLPPGAAAPTVDLRPLEEKLDRNADLMRERLDRIASLLETRPPVPDDGAQAPLPSGTRPPRELVDEAAEQAAAAATAQVEAVRQEVQTAQQENGRLREAVEGLRGLVQQVAGDRETLRERFEARLEKVKTELGEGAGRPEIARAYVRDLVAEKLGNPGTGLTVGKLLGGALGLSAPLAFALAAAAWLVSRRVGSKLESGEPLLVQKLFDRLGDKLDDLKDRIRDQPGGSGKT
jgi:hypothetical protein